MDFELDPLFKTIILDLMTQGYSVVDHFIGPKTVSLLRYSSDRISLRTVSSRHRLQKAFRHLSKRRQDKVFYCILFKS